MEGMFYGVISGDIIGGVKNWDTSNVTNMSYLFAETSSLDVFGFDSWDVSKVTTMKKMFSYTHKNNTSRWSGVGQLYSADFSNWDVSKVTDMSGMFRGYRDAIGGFLKTIGDWNTSNVTDMSYMFFGGTWRVEILRIGM